MQTCLSISPLTFEIRLPGSKSWANPRQAPSIFLTRVAEEARWPRCERGQGGGAAAALSAYYLERALTPFAEVTRAHTANLDQATADLAKASPSIIIFSDVGRISGNARATAQGLVEKGGMLIRFAGPRLEQGGDSLLPAPLREGGRTLGGTMTWTSPQKPAAFEQDSPFKGLAIPADVTVSQQVLADPAAMPRDAKVWARLMDGTPLVTAAKRGAGTLVFFHITANPDWSNLPISGLFVEMMRKIFELAPLQVSQSGKPAAAREAPSVPSQDDLEALARAGRLRQARRAVGSREGDPAFREREGAGEAANPAGLYGPQNALHAINVIKDGTRFSR